MRRDRLVATFAPLLYAAVALALFVLLPRHVSDFHTLDLARAGVFFIGILGLNIVTGYAGQISLGHGALMAVGGYTTAVLMVHEGIRDIWTIPAAGVVAAAAGFVVGLPALRLTGLYLALATFALGVALPSFLKKFSGLTGGSLGLRMLEQRPDKVTGVAGTVTVFGHTTTQNHFLYYLTWSIGLVLAALAWLLLRGRLGRAFRAIRDSELAAASSGIDLARYKTLAFAISGFYAGIAGSLLAVIDEIVNPLTFTFALSVTLLVGAVVGGLGSLAGVAVGAFFVQYLPDLAQHVSKSPGAPSVVYGAAVVILMVLLPTGAGGLLRRAAEPLTRRLYTRS